MPVFTVDLLPTEQCTTAYAAKHISLTSARLSYNSNYPSPPHRPYNERPNMTSEPAKWQLISWQKKDEQRARIPTEWLLNSTPTADVTNYLDVPRKCGILSAEEVKITEDYDATALAEAIRARRLTSVNVVRAFCKVCSSPHPQVTFAS
jgi:hypothetical protein